MRKRLLLVGVAVSLPASQLGHAASYAARFGSRAVRVQQSGAHAYFPSAFNFSGALVAAALVSALLLLGGTRILLGRHSGSRLVSRVPLAALIVMMAGLQLATYMAQETVESLAAGYPVPDVSTVLVWGITGQLPVALLTALALYWLSLRVELAVSRWSIALQRQRSAVAPAAVVATPMPADIVVRAQSEGRVHRGRAPPVS